MTKTVTLENLQSTIEKFRTERDWHQFHTPKNLVMALSVECAELLEIFQWLTPDQSVEPGHTTRLRIEEEIGDVMIYLSLLSSTLGVDPIDAALRKMKVNERKHPVSGDAQSPGK